MGFFIDVWLILELEISPARPFLDYRIDFVSLDDVVIFAISIDYSLHTNSHKSMI